MDDGRIRELAEEVLKELRVPSPSGSRDLEGRVAALEREVARLRQAGAPSLPEPAIHVHVERHALPIHPSQQPMGVGSGSERCVLEPDKPCVQSGQCRALGH